MPTAKTVPANRRSIAQDKFTWTVPGTRKKVTLKSAAYLTMRQAEALQEAGRTKDSAKTKALLLDLGSTAADREAMLDVPQIHLKALLNAWAKDGSDSLGK